MARGDEAAANAHGRQRRDEIPQGPCMVEKTEGFFHGQGPPRHGTIRNPIPIQQCSKWYAVRAVADKNILVINCGSSSLKYEVYQMPQRISIGRGLIERSAS